MQKQTLNLSKQLWINQRKIDEFGLILPYNRERQFNIQQCTSSLQNLLAKKQAEGLPIHYANYLNHKEYSPLEFQVITYKGYLIGRCPQSNLGDEKSTKRGEIQVEYRIIRLNKNTINCLYPYLLLFELRIQDFHCKTCESVHLYRIYKSSFEAIRMQFIIEVSNKIQFMNKYLNYLFEPSSFVSTREHGLTPFIRLKYQDYQSAEYFEISEEILINGFRIHCLREGLDFEGMRLDDYVRQMHLSESEKQKLEQQFTCHEVRMKTKYICRKCKEKVIWTTKNKVKIKYHILTLAALPPLIKDKRVYDEDEELLEFTKKMIQKEKVISEHVDKQYLHNYYKFQADKLDKSLIREVEEYEEYKSYFGKFGRWHSELQKYSYPYLVLVSIKIPQMSCTGCQKQKDGLIYVSNLINFTNGAISVEIAKRVKQLIKKKYIGKE